MLRLAKFTLVVATGVLAVPGTAAVLPNLHALLAPTAVLQSGNPVTNYSDDEPWPLPPTTVRDEDRTWMWSASDTAFLRTIDYSQPPQDPNSGWSGDFVGNLMDRRGGTLPSEGRMGGGRRHIGGGGPTRSVMPPKSGGGGPKDGPVDPGPGTGPGDNPGPDPSPSRGRISGEFNTNTGNYLHYYPITGWSSVGTSYLSLGLFHNSSSWYSSGALGYGWSHSYDARVDFHAPSGKAVLRLPNGILAPYQRIGSTGDFTGPVGWRPRLIMHSGAGLVWGYSLIWPDQTIWMFGNSSGFSGNFGYLNTIIFRCGNHLTVNRNTNGRVQSVATSDGRAVTFNYTGNLLTSFSDFTGRTWLLSHKDFDTEAPAGHMSGLVSNLEKIQSPALPNLVRRTWTFDYDRRGNIRTLVDGRGKTWEWNFGSTSTPERLNWFRTPYPHQTNLTYFGDHTRVQAPGGGVWEHYYNNGNLVAVRDPSGHNFAFSYNSEREVTQFRDELGRQWNYSRDSSGNITQLTLPGNRTWSFQYNASNDLTRITSPLNHITQFAYSPKGELTSVVDGLNRTVYTATYDAVGQLLWERDALNRQTSYTYNTNGDVVSVTDPANLTTHLAYDTLGRLTTSTLGTLQTQVSYDALDRTAEVSSPSSGWTEVTYDLEDNVLSVEDPLGRTTTFAYDDDGRPTNYTNGRGDTHTFTYSALGLLQTIVNGRGHTTSLVPNTRYNLARIVFPDGQDIYYTEYPTGRTDQMYQGLMTRNFAYSERGELTGIDYGIGPDVTFGYDNSGRKTSMVDGTGTTTWTYNAADELTSLVQPQGTITYQYFADGQIHRIVGPTAVGTKTFGYDAAGRLTSLQNGVGETTSWLYDAWGRVSRQTFNAGHYEEYLYDAAWRLIQANVRNSGGTSLRSQSYSYNVADEIVGHTLDSVFTSFTYDGVGQLLTESRPGHTASYTYDANGNRTGMTLNGGAHTFVYDSGDKLTSYAFPGGSRSYAYNSAGQMTSVTQGSSTTTLTWNHAGRITNIVGPGLNATYTYNGLGARTGISGTGGPRTFLRNGAHVTAPVLSDGSATYTPGISERRSGSTRFSHTGLKSADAQSTSSQTIAATRQYGAFGQITASTGTWNGPFGHAGPFGYQEDPSGLQLLGHRYYDPATGRFLSRDPILDGRNFYAYGGGYGAPTGFVDPDGLSACMIMAGARTGGSIGAFLGPKGAVAGAVVGVIVVGAGILLTHEFAPAPELPRVTEAHKNNKRPSTKHKHEQGTTRQGRDQQKKEKGDRRRNQSKPRNPPTQPPKDSADYLKGPKKK